MCTVSHTSDRLESTDVNLSIYRFIRKLIKEQFTNHVQVQIKKKNEIINYTIFLLFFFVHNCKDAMYVMVIMHVILFQ